MSPVEFKKSENNVSLVLWRISNEDHVKLDIEIDGDLRTVK